MKSSVTKTFRKRLNDLPTSVQEQAAKAYALWQEDPYYPSLQFKRVSQRQPIYIDCCKDRSPSPFRFGEVIILNIYNIKELPMASITVDIPDEQLQKLQQLARDSQVSPEDLLRVNIEDWLARPQDEFTQAASYVLKKNVELYRRLA
jgi:antitoxin FitA